MSRKQITPFGVIISQNLGDQACMHSQIRGCDTIHVWCPLTCMSAECSCACVKHLGTSISDANISSQNMIMLMMPSSQDTNVPHSALKLHACQLQPTDSGMNTLFLTESQSGSMTNYHFLLVRSDANLNLFSFFLFSLFFLKSAAYHHNFSSAWIENHWDCRETKTPQVECSSQKPLSHSVS
jgi:hypothetical protein